MTDEVACSTHPCAPHGFNRNGSHQADRYVCECEGWHPERTCCASVGYVIRHRDKFYTVNGMTNDVQLALRFARYEDAEAFWRCHGMPGTGQRIVPVQMAYAAVGP